MGKVSQLAQPQKNEEGERKRIHSMADEQKKGKNADL